MARVIASSTPATRAISVMCEARCRMNTFWICRLGPASFFALSPSSDREEGENEDQTKERSYDTTYQGVLIHLVLIFGLRWVVYSVVRVDGICQGVKGECLVIFDYSSLSFGKEAALRTCPSPISTTSTLRVYLTGSASSFTALRMYSLFRQPSALELGL